MTSIELLHDLQLLTIEEYTILTEDKNKWHTYNKSKKFNLEKKFWSIIYK